MTGTSGPDEPTTGRPNQTFETYKPPFIPGVFGEECLINEEATHKSGVKHPFRDYLPGTKKACNFGAWQIVDSEGYSQGGGGTRYFDPEHADSRWPVFVTSYSGPGAKEYADKRRKYWEDLMEKNNWRLVLTNPLPNFFGELDTDGDGELNTSIYNGDRTNGYMWTMEDGRYHPSVQSCVRHWTETRSCKYNFETKTWSTVKGKNVIRTYSDIGVKLLKRPKKSFGTGETSYYYCTPTRPIADDEELTDENCKTYEY
jgi:hypothetical protein